MPIIGETKSAKQIGKKGTHRVIWVACPVCGNERWVSTRSVYKGKQYLCKPCGARHTHKASWNKTGRWKGGKTICGGYVKVLLKPDDFFYSMAPPNNSKGCANRYVLEHRLVMAKHLGRCLLPWEIVHHKGTKHSRGSKENRCDNRIENLQLLAGRPYHIVDSLLKSLVRRQAMKIEELEKRIALLEETNADNDKLL